MTQNLNDTAEADAYARLLSPEHITEMGNRTINDAEKAALIHLARQAVVRRSLAIEKMKTGASARGFSLVEFRDKYGQECSLQESSIATQACVWFGVDRGIKDGNYLQDIHARMHLTQEQVINLLPYLHYFAETGYLPRAEETEIDPPSTMETVVLRSPETLDKTIGDILILSKEGHYHIVSWDDEEEHWANVYAPTDWWVETDNIAGWAPMNAFLAPGLMGDTAWDFIRAARS
jgi:hypothetical protein